MAIRDLFRRKPSRVVVATRSFVFGDMESAQQFQAQMSTGYGSRGVGSRRAWSAFAESASIAARYGGHMFRSTSGRELHVYGYEQEITQSTRSYLFNRDPTAAMFIEKPWADMWNGFPRTFIPQVDDYFAEQQALGLLTALQASYQEWYQEGGAFIMLETDGDPKTRLSRSERPLGWCFIPAEHVVNEFEGEHRYYLTGQDNVDPLLDHGIEFVSLYPTESARAENQPIVVHGSRLIPINLDARFQKWWRTPNIPLNRIYDSLWELRDIIFSRVRGHFQGDPIVVDVDISEDAQKLMNFGEMSKTERDAMSAMVEQSILDYNTGAKSSFAPVMGFKLRRLGAAQLPDPKEDVMMLSSRLSHGSVFPVKMVLASTKGSSDVGDQDLLIYSGNIQNVRNVWGYKHLSKALLMGRVMGVNGLRMQDPHEMPPPTDIEWPTLRPLTPRDAAFTENTDIKIYRQAQEAGLIPPPRLLRKFSQDPRYQKPLWLAARGRDINGKSMDPKPAAGGGGSDALLDIQERLESISERLEEEVQVTSKHTGDAS